VLHPNDRGKREKGKRIRKRLLFWERSERGREEPCLYSSAEKKRPDFSEEKKGRGRARCVFRFRGKRETPNQQKEGTASGFPVRAVGGKGKKEKPHTAVKGKNISNIGEQLKNGFKNPVIRGEGKRVVRVAHELGSAGREKRSSCA